MQINTNHHRWSDKGLALFCQDNQEGLGTALQLQRFDERVSIVLTNDSHILIYNNVDSFHLSSIAGTFFGNRKHRSIKESVGKVKLVTMDYAKKLQDLKEK